MSAPDKLVRVTVELPAGIALGKGLVAAMEPLTIESDGTLRRPFPQAFRGQPLPVVGTWALVDGPLIP